jgi:hypothetical protein
VIIVRKRGTIIELTYHGADDIDHCSASGCRFSGGDAENETVRVSYSQGSAQGHFGYMDGATFVQSSDPELITHWKAPDSTGGAMGMAAYLDVTLSVLVEDDPPTR